MRLEFIGDISRLPGAVQENLAQCRRTLSGNTGLTLVLALNYGGRQDIIQACNSLIREGVPEISESLLSGRLHTAGLPDPDLIIRTSGEFRVSNFLLWQIAYAEFYITPVLWPDFQPRHFFEAILSYQSRQRRYGAVL